MNMQFNALGKKPVEESDAFEAQDFSSDIQSEELQRGQKMTTPTAALDEPPQAPGSDGLVIEGVLVGHGMGKPSASAQISYFMRVVVGDGEPTTYWHTDMKKFIDAAGTKTNDKIHAERSNGSWQISVREASVVNVQQAKPPGDSFSELMQLAAGKRSAASVDMSASAAPAAATAFASVPAAAADEVMDIFKKKHQQASREAKKAAAEKATVQTGPTDFAAPEAGEQSAKGVPGVAKAQAVSPDVAGIASGAAAAGAVAAALVASPFAVLSSATRALKQKFGTTPAAAVVPTQPSNSKGALQQAIFQTMGSITSWKCERIEKSGTGVRREFDRLVDNDAFQAWQSKVSQTADFHAMTSAQVISELPTNEAFAPLRDEMDKFWRDNESVVDSYRRACDDFERNISNVVKEFPNTDEKVRERVMSAMKDVEGLTEMIPGFGDEVGTYRKTLAERVRAIAEMIQEFINSVVSKVTGSAPSNNEMTV